MQYPTIEDLYGFPNDGSRRELVQGRLVSEPPVGFRHGRLAALLIRAIDECERTKRDGVVVCEVGFVLDRDRATVRAPDVAYVTRERLPPIEAQGRFFEGAPDLAVEVLSPGDREPDINAKVRDYLAAGTVAVWVVDPQARRVRVWQPPQTPTVLGVDDVLEAPGLLPGLGLSLRHLFEA